MGGSEFVKDLKGKGDGGLFINKVDRLCRRESGKDRNSI